MNGDTWIFLALCGALLVFLLMASFLSKSYSLDRIKSKTVGDGQHGTARWATPKEIGKTYYTVPFRPRRHLIWPRRWSGYQFRKPRVLFRPIVQGA